MIIASSDVRRPMHMEHNTEALFSIAVDVASRMELRILYDVLVSIGATPWDGVNIWSCGPGKAGKGNSESDIQSSLSLRTNRFAWLADGLRMSGGVVPFFGWEASIRTQPGKLIGAAVIPTRLAIEQNICARDSGMVGL
jgi:hypothetical protein